MNLNLNLIIIKFNKKMDDYEINKSFKLLVENKQVSLKLKNDAVEMYCKQSEKSYVFWANSDKIKKLMKDITLELSPKEFYDFIFDRISKKEYELFDKVETLEFMLRFSTNNVIQNTLF